MRHKAVATIKEFILASWLPASPKSWAYQLGLLVVLTTTVLLRALVSTSPNMAAAAQLAALSPPESRSLPAQVEEELLKVFPASPLDNSARLILLGDLSHQAKKLQLSLKHRQLTEKAQTQPLSTQKLLIQIKGPAVKQIQLLDNIQHQSPSLRLVAFDWAPGDSQEFRLLELTVELLIQAASK